jgi:FlaA1/EpsC-like NDP-sugar epimerase
VSENAQRDIADSIVESGSGRVSRSRWQRILGNLSIDLLLINFALIAAEGICMSLGQNADRVVDLPFMAAMTGAGAALLLARSIYSNQPRYFGLFDVFNIGGVWVLLSIFGGALAAIKTPASSPTVAWALPTLFSLILIPLLAAHRIGQYLASSRRLRLRIHRKRTRIRTLVVGAGDAGEIVTRESQRTPKSERHVIGLVDDDLEKRWLRVHGVPVLGTTDDIPDIVERHQIDEILLAIPSASGETMRKIVGTCMKTAARVRTLPELASLLSCKPQLSRQIRDIQMEDLLRRQPVKIDEGVVAGTLRHARVLITGAGGSIGSELARQICSMRPASLVLLGRGENSIFEIEQELIYTLGYEPHVVIADVRDRQSMEAVFKTHRPDLVFHAAAHKHVPLMEANPIEAVRNNVLGTQITAELAVKYGSRKFVYVSTDKAVKPSSVMGATKRAGEMIVSMVASRSETDFAIVRFGNVLGSRGSLLPTLEKQIRRGSPVRVTHPDMTRYFMTIPEAAQLILQASTFGSRGDIFILDMGQPVKILDLVHDLIRLHGLTPEEDVPVLIVGVRPGEKIHEELVCEDEQLNPTAHPKIRMVRSSLRDQSDWIEDHIREIYRLCDAADVDLAKERLMELANWTSLDPFTPKVAAKQSVQP